MSRIPCGDSAHASFAKVKLKVVLGLKWFGLEAFNAVIVGQPSV
jgi:hypothetical protein